MAGDRREVPQALLQLQGPTVSLLVGPDKEELVLHRSIATRCPFMKMALKNEWDAGRGSISLPDDQPQTVRAYAHFLYTNTFPCKVEKFAKFAAHAEENTLLANLYVLAEKFQDTHCQNCLIDAIIAKADLRNRPSMGWYFTGPEVDIIYKGTCEGDPLRKLLVDTHVELGTSSWVKDHAVKNTEFLTELCVRMLDDGEERFQNDEGLLWTVTENCAYHKHKDGEGCREIP